MKVLLVEDSEKLQRSLQKGLRRSGFVVDAARSGEDGLWLATENDYDVVLLDLMLPGIDGLTVLRTIRERGRTVHVLILTARDLLADRVLGLDAGADDYLVKPFDFDELVARLRALARRAHHHRNPVVVSGPLRIETTTRRVLVGGREVHLSPREFALLERLALRAGEVVRRSELAESLFEFESEAGSNVLDVTVCAVRRKLADAGVGDVVRTRRGEGYAFDPPAAS